MDRFAKRNAAWKAWRWNTSGGAVRLSNEEGFSVLTKKQKQMRGGGGISRGMAGVDDFFFPRPLDNNYRCEEERFRGGETKQRSRSKSGNF